jgi:aminopeptidase YwaD
VQAGLKPIHTSFFQAFTYSTQTFPKQMALSINGKKLKPGVDFIIDPVSASAKGKAQLMYLDSTFFSVKTVHSKDLSFRNKAIVYDQKFYKQLSELPVELIQKIYAASCIIEINHAKLTMDVGSRPLSIPIFKLGPTDLSFVRSGTCSFHLYAKYEEDYTSKNVVGYLKGSTKPDSFLVFTAHYDHLGRLGKKTYFPGANDNASGIAMLNELARYYGDSTHQLPYSILFIGFAGEEAGLIGSKYFTEHPLIDLKSIKFLINMDIMGTGDESITVVNATKYPIPFNTLDSLNKAHAYIPAVIKRGPAANSDHYYFSQKGVPAFFIYTNGKQKAYHDVFDVPSNLKLEHFGSLFHLLVDFSKTF